MKGVGLKKTTLAGLFCLISVLNFLAGCGQNNFTGTFVADSRPHQIFLLTLIQTKDTVSGSLIIAKPDGNGRMDSDTLPLRGTTDGNAITLTADRLFGELIINGRKEGVNVVLMFPTSSGSISNLTLIPTTENDYNGLLKQWQEELAAMHLERETLTKLANALSDDIDTIKATGIKGDMIDIKSALADEQSALIELENDLGQLKNDASLRPMTCYQANQTVRYDFEQTLGYDYRQTLGYANNQFQTAVNQLEERLSKVESMVAKIKKEREIFDQAIKASKFPLPKFSVEPGEDTSALQQYQSIATSSRNELPTLKSETDKILNKANNIMREGKLVMEKAQSIANCR